MCAAQVSSGGVSVHQVNDFMLPLVRSLAGPGPVGSEPGAQERAQLRECLKTLPLFPTESSYQPAPVSDAHVMSGQTASPRAALKLSKVTQLFDPRVTALRELFPEDRFFPAKPYVADSVALNVLRDLGMTSTATLEVWRSPFSCLPCHAWLFMSPLLMLTVLLSLALGVTLSRAIYSFARVRCLCARLK